MTTTTNTIMTTTDLRQAVAARVGLTAESSNAEIFGAFDSAAREARDRRLAHALAAAQAAEDALYRLAFGEPAPVTASVPAATRDHDLARLAGWAE